MSDGQKSDREMLYKAKLESSLLLDKIIITLAAGTFGLSLSFIFNIKSIVFIPVLILGWFFCGVTIIMTLLSIGASQKACGNHIRSIDGDTSVNIKKWPKITYGHL